MRRLILTLSLSVLTLIGYGQKQVDFKINHLLNGESFEFNKTSSNDIGTNFNVSRLEYYISELSIIHDGGKETPIKDFWILEDASKGKTHSLGSLDVTKIDSIKFSIGVNKDVNHLDPSKYALGHPLAPKSPSMHWGWTAGYRFVAIEGKAGLDVDKRFEIHALGDKNYFSQCIPVTAKEVDGKFLIELNADYSEALASIDVSRNVTSHGETGEAEVLLQNFWTKVFKSLDGKGNTLSVDEVSLLKSDISIYPNPSNGSKVHILNNGNAKITSIQIFGMDGKLVEELSGKDALTIELSEQKAGMYIVQIQGENNLILSRKRLVVK